MTKQEIKDIKNAWAQSLGYDDFRELDRKLTFDDAEVESLLEFSYKNSHKFVKEN